LLISVLEGFDDLHFCIPSLKDSALVLGALSTAFSFEMGEQHRQRDFHGCNEIISFPLDFSRPNKDYQNQGGKKSTLHSV
jgi:hypothetical protein